MNYLKTYYNLLTRAKRENRQRGDGRYYEAHHVKPNCLGGKFLVLLTAREHYIAHFLLYKHFKKHGNKNQKIKMARAWKAMTFSSHDNIERYNSHTFELARIAFNESMSGESHPFYGKKHSDETRKVISDKLLSNTEWRNNASLNMKEVRKNVTKEQEEYRINKVKEVLTGKPNVMLNKKHTEEAKKNMSNAAIGKKKSEKHKQNISKGWEKRESKTCPHCGKESKNASVMLRWHFDNCKKLINDSI